MKISQLVKLAPTLYMNGISVHVQSKPGTGKSDMIENDIPKAIQKALSLDSFDVKLANLTSYEAPDIRGFCIPVKGDDGKMRARFTQSPLTPENMSENGILFLDEFSQASTDVQKPAADLKLHGRAGESQLPPGWRVWSAGNRMSDKAGVVKPLSHVTNRHMVINLEFDLDDWCDWAVSKGIDPLFIAFARFKPGSINQDVPTTPDPYATPRSYASLAKLAHDYTGGNISEALVEDNMFLEMAIGTVGKATATEAVGFMKVAAELPTWSAILASPEKEAKKLPKGRMDVVFSATQMVIHNLEHGNLKEAFTFTTALPKEFQTATVRMFLKKLGPSALNLPEFSKWTQENPTLIQNSF